MMIEFGLSTLKLRRDKSLLKKASLDENLIKIEIISNYNMDIRFQNKNIPAFYRCIDLLSSEWPNITAINEIFFGDCVLHTPWVRKDNVYFFMPDRGNDDYMNLKHNWLD